MIFLPVRIPRLHVITSIIKNNREGLLKSKKKEDEGAKVLTSTREIWNNSTTCGGSG